MLGMSGIRSLLHLLMLYHDTSLPLKTQKEIPDAFRRPPSEAVDNVNPSAIPLARWSVSLIHACLGSLAMAETHQMDPEV
jgi:hypothetical protein